MTDGRPTDGDGQGPATATSTDSELRRSSAAFLLELANVHGLETRKAAMLSDDPERPTVAREIEDRVAILMGRSAYQRRLVDEDFHAADGGRTRLASEVLKDWRDAEHRMSEARSTLQRAIEESERYHMEYRVAFERDRDGR